MAENGGGIKLHFLNITLGNRGGAVRSNYLNLLHSYCTCRFASVALQARYHHL